MCPHSGSERSDATGTASQQPFRFIRLPREFRLIIYDLLRFVRCHRRIDVQDQGATHIETAVVAHGIIGHAVIFTCQECYVKDAYLFRNRTLLANADLIRLVVDWRALHMFLLESLHAIATEAFYNPSCVSKRLPSIAFSASSSDRSNTATSGPMENCTDP